MMKFLIGALVAFLVGAACRYFDIPVPSPPVLPGALLVVATTLGYTAVDRALSRTAHISTTKHLCGGASGMTVESNAGKDVRMKSEDPNLRGDKS